MIRVKIAELRDRLSQHLRAVEKGAEVVVTDRNRPIARIVPIGPEKKSAMISPTRSFATLRRRRYEPARWEVDSTSLLMEERRER